MRALIATRVLAGILVVAAVACGTTSRGGADSLPGTVPPDANFPEPPSASPPAPQFSLTLIDGTRVTGSRLWEERPLVLVFFASWCGACARQQADLTEITERYGDAVAFLGVAGEDTPEDLHEYLDEHKVPYAAGIDGDLGIWRAYGVREPPHVVVISKGGRVNRGWQGEGMADLITETLAGLIERSG